MFKLNFRTPGRHGYSVQFSPFTADRLVCAACENYGIQGRGSLYYLQRLQDGTIYTNAVFDWPDGLFDVSWSEGNPDVSVAASGDGSLQLWSLLKQDGPIQVVKEHTKEVYSVEWCQQREDKFASASWDGTVKVWNPMVMSSLCTFYGHQNVVYCVAWSPHIHGCLASASGDHTVRIWNMKSPQSGIVVIQGHNAEILHCDWNKYNQNVLVTGAVDGLVRGWDLRNPHKCIFELQEHQYAVRRVKYSPHHESVLATVSYDFSTRYFAIHMLKDSEMVKNINVFSRETRIWDPKHTTHSIALIYNHTEFVYGLDFNLHVDGQLADCGFDELLCIYNPQCLQQLY